MKDWLNWNMDSSNIMSKIKYWMLKYGKRKVFRWAMISNNWYYQKPFDCCVINDGKYDCDKLKSLHRNKRIKMKLTFLQTL